MKVKTIEQKTKILKTLLGIDFPLIQAGMVWVSGGKLAAAAANSGILGTIGAGSMSPELLREQIKKAKESCQDEQSYHRVAVNFPLLYEKIEEQIQIAMEEGIQVFITSAGSPKKLTPLLKSKGKTVIHVCSSAILAKKCVDAGVDAIIAEGFEAGGHNGRDETTSLCLIQDVSTSIDIPIIAAGGFSNGRSILAALVLGASGVQMGTRFITAEESSAHPSFKQKIIESKEGDTKLMMKKHVPVRLVHNEFSQEVAHLENQGASKQELIELLGKGRAKKGMLLGDLTHGELEAGQISSLIDRIEPTAEIIASIKKEYQVVLNEIKLINQ